MAFVYILRSGDGDLFKIGRTRGDVESRRKHLSTGNPQTLTVFDSIETDDVGACEAYLHASLQSKRCAGDAREFFTVSTAELEAAIRAVRQYLAEDLPRQKQAERLAKQECDGQILRPGDEEWETYRRLLQVRETEHGVGLERMRLENELKLVIGTAASLDGIATWKAHLVRKFDEASFKRAEPAMHKAFVRESRVRQFRLR
jgi:Meiotically up-regulated gene 113